MESPSVRIDFNNDHNARSRARDYLTKFLKDYSPANDLERSIYEFCKTELNRISPQSGKTAIP